MTSVAWAYQNSFKHQCMVSRSQLKYIQSLGQKKYRDEEGVFVAEGPKLVKELIESHVELTQVYALNEWIEENKDLLKVGQCNCDQRDRA